MLTSRTCLGSKCSKTNFKYNCFFQSHLLGVFDNVNEAEFHATDYDKILAVISQEGEKLSVCNVNCISKL